MTGRTRSPIRITIKGLALGDLPLRVMVARGKLTQAIGLSFRNCLPDDGMLFTFKKKKRIPFWMWGMKFPIDLLWICDGQIIGWEENLRPPRSWLQLFFPFFLKRYQSDIPVNQVLEVEAGFCRQHGMDKAVGLSVEVDQI